MGAPSLPDTLGHQAADPFKGQAVVLIGKKFGGDAHPRQQGSGIDSHFTQQVRNAEDRMDAQILDQPVTSFPLGGMRQGIFSCSYH